MDGLDIDTLRRWAWTARDALREHRDLLDTLNVFPSPDHDTGSNMLRFWEAFACALLGVPDDVPVGDALVLAVAQCLDVEGNSVTLTYGWLTGLAGPLRGLPQVRPAHLADAFGNAATQARTCLPAPVEGTMLTVFDAAARTWSPAVADGATPAEAAAATDRHARAALSAHDVPRHPAWNDAAPAEDAGAFAARIVLHALTRTLTPPDRPPPALHIPRPPGPSANLPGPRSHDEPGREVQATVRAEEPALRPLRTAGGPESVVVAPDALDPDLWHVHYHTTRSDDPLADLHHPGLTVVNYRITPLTPEPNTPHAPHGHGVRVLSYVRSPAEIASSLDRARHDGAEEAVLLVVGEPLWAEAGDHLSEARFQSPGFAAVGIPGKDEKAATAAAAAFSATCPLGEVVLAMFTAARTRPER